MRRLVIAGAVVLAAAGCSSGGSTSSGSSGSASGVRACGSTPSQVQDTVNAIHNGGPFARRKDGSTYQNRNRFLPVRANGFYREYTVRTPGANTAGTRRVVTGGDPRRNPPWLFYTDNHYTTFCRLGG